MAFAGCACSLENVMIRRAYGHIGYGVVLFTTAFWFYMTVKDGSRGNPVAHIMAYMKGDMKSSMMLTRMAFQLMGGLSSYRYARYFWYLEFTKVCDALNCTDIPTIADHLQTLNFQTVRFSISHHKSQEKFTFHSVMARRK